MHGPVLLRERAFGEAAGEGVPLRPPSLPNSRSDASREELAELAQQANPEEIQLGEEEDEDEMDLEPNGQWPTCPGVKVKGRGGPLSILPAEE